MCVGLGLRGGQRDAALCHPEAEGNALEHPEEAAKIILSLAGTCSEGSGGEIENFDALERANKLQAGDQALLLVLAAEKGRMIFLDLARGQQPCNAGGLELAHLAVQYYVPGSRSEAFTVLVVTGEQSWYPGARLICRRKESKLVNYGFFRLALWKMGLSTIIKGALRLSQFLKHLRITVKRIAKFLPKLNAREIRSKEEWVLGGGRPAPCFPLVVVVDTELIFTHEETEVKIPEYIHRYPDSVHKKWKAASGQFNVVQATLICCTAHGVGTAAVDEFGCKSAVLLALSSCPCLEASLLCYGLWYHGTGQAPNHIMLAVPLKEVCLFVDYLCAQRT
ncbi:hypothetical protein Anapl_00036 [Anas platyrhynchos]|uniref:Uncharacterized protein n=1 Tax=Anas platyrhynchos TaxID=8839 RepID=R0LPZ7_ANAPL|nr:hypothetical protein Anapl_00036 [Anas platyrhynchos]